jgi:hypothetical protein
VPAASGGALAGAFQDFFRFEFRARTRWVGRRPRLDDEPPCSRRRSRGAGDVVARLAAGLDTQLGPTWPGGSSFRSASGRSCAGARLHARSPLLLVLDEPTAALDAETEHACSSATPQRRWHRRRIQAGLRSWFHTASRLSAWPISSSCSTGHGWWK